MSEVDFTKSKSIIEGLLRLFKRPTIPSPPPSKRENLSSVVRPGLSATEITSRILKKQRAAGILSGPNDDGSANISEQMEFIRVEEIVNAILLDAKVTVVNLPGQTVKTEGVSPAGPVSTVGTTLTTSNAYGLIS